MADGVYVNNSAQKEFVRDQWVEFAKEIYEGKEHDFGIVTFPAEGMQDLHLFKERGLIDWEIVETESSPGNPNFKITKGNVRCFETKTSIYNKISEKLISAKVNNTDFCAYVNAQYTRIINGSDKTFPVDVVNLDFEARLYSNLKYPIDSTIKNIFEFQKKHKRDFSLFLTWSIEEAADLQEFKELIKDVIARNLEDPSAIKFKSSFNKEFKGVDELHYERKSAIGVSKVVIKKASHHLYKLTRNAFYVYGGNPRSRMISLLFNFTYDGSTGKENILYSNDVASSLLEVVDINKIPKD